MNTFLIRGKKMKLTFTELVEEMNDLLWKNVNSFKKSVHCPWVDEDDIYQEFLIGMWEAVKNYDINKGHFTTHLIYQIRKTQHVIMSNLMSQKRDISKTDTRDIGDFLYEPKPVYDNIITEEERMWDKLMFESLDETLKFDSQDEIILSYILGETTIGELQDYMGYNSRSSVHHQINKLKTRIRNEVEIQC